MFKTTSFQMCVCEQQLDYDSRVVQRRIYEEALLEITHPALTKGMHSKWKSVSQIQPLQSVSHYLLHITVSTCIFCLISVL